MMTQMLEDIHNLGTSLNGVKPGDEREKGDEDHEDDDEKPLVADGKGIACRLVIRKGLHVLLGLIHVSSISGDLGSCQRTLYQARKGPLLHHHEDEALEKFQNSTNGKNKCIMHSGIRETDNTSVKCHDQSAIVVA